MMYKEMYVYIYITPLCLVSNVTQFEKTSSCRLLKIIGDIRILGHMEGDYSCYTPCATEKTEASFGKHGRQRICESSFGTAPATSYIVNISLSVTYHFTVLQNG